MATISVPGLTLICGIHSLFIICWQLFYRKEISILRAEHMMPLFQRSQHLNFGFNFQKPGDNKDMDDKVHKNWKDDLRVDGLSKKLHDEMSCFCLMHMQGSLLCHFWVAAFIKVAIKRPWFNLYDYCICIY